MSGPPGAAEMYLFPPNANLCLTLKDMGLLLSERF